MKIGVLALQGNFHQHSEILSSLNIENVFVKEKSDLDSCDALIIPGGESSTISKLIDRNNLRKSIKSFSKIKSIFGTCAGMILLSSNKREKHMIPLSIMNMEVKRNANGSQIDSFSDYIDIKIHDIKSYYSYFIRSPKIKKIGKNIKILGEYKSEAVLISDGKHLASTFHPEITDNKIHQYFLSLIK